MTCTLISPPVPPLPPKGAESSIQPTRYLHDDGIQPTIYFNTTPEQESLGRSKKIPLNFYLEKIGKSQIVEILSCGNLN